MSYAKRPASLARYTVQMNMYAEIITWTVSVIQTLYRVPVAHANISPVVGIQMMMMTQAQIPWCGWVF